MRELLVRFTGRVSEIFQGRSNSVKSKQEETRIHDQFVSFANMEKDAILTMFKSSLEGLNSKSVETLQKEFGTNEILRENSSVWHEELLGSIKNPFNLLLTAIALISYFTGDLAGAIIVAVMIFISVILSFTQEYRSNRAAEKLKAMVTMTATVTRKRPLEDEESSSEISDPAQKFEIPIKELVPGDIIQLSAGDMLPADVFLLKSKDLFITQSALTGESLPVEKHANPREDLTDNILELQNICFMGTSVISGTATALVLQTGARTYFGSIAKSITGKRALTSFDKGIYNFSWLMLYFMFAMAPIVLIINGFTKGDWTEAFMFTLAVAVGLTPEMLPMIVTVNLAVGARKMAKKHVIVKRLTSIQNFGAMDVLCTDKTGTLTQDKVILLKCVDPNGIEDELNIMQYAYLNSYYQTGLKNLLDHAVLNHVKENVSRKPQSRYRKIDEIPFDFQRRRMSVVVEEDGDGHLLICKGALEEVLKVSSSAEIQGNRIPLDETVHESMLTLAKDFSEDGLRVLALAYKEMPKDRKEYSISDESELILLGFLAFLDPPKETAARAIEALNKHGVSVKVLTGDNEYVTRKICKEVGLNADSILLGHEIEKMSNEELGEYSETHSVFAKLTPAQKQRIIRAMHAKGHVVGFLGDGINDAPALKEADVGISVDNAVDIAKESADIILLEKNLLVLEEGALEGRRVFGNIVKYLRMGASSNFGNVFSVVGASLFLPFLPIMPIQLLIQNLLYDLSQTAIPFDKVDDEYLQKPRKWEIADIRRYMFFIGPVSSLFDYLTFALLWFFFAANSETHQNFFQSGWFVESLISQTLIVHLLRTNKIPFLQSTSSMALGFTTLTVILIAIYIPFSPFAARIGLTPLPLSFFFWLVPLLLAYVVLSQVVKNYLVKHLEEKASS